MEIKFARAVPIFDYLYVVVPKKSWNHKHIHKGVIFGLIGDRKFDRLGLRVPCLNFSNVRIGAPCIHIYEHWTPFEWKLYLHNNLKYYTFLCRKRKKKESTNWNVHFLVFDYLKEKCKATELKKMACKYQYCSWLYICDYLYWH